MSEENQILRELIAESNVRAGYHFKGKEEVQESAIKHIRKFLLQDCQHVMYIGNKIYMLLHRNMYNLRGRYYLLIDEKQTMQLIECNGLNAFLEKLLEGVEEIRGAYSDPVFESNIDGDRQKEYEETCATVDKMIKELESQEK